MGEELFVKLRDCFTAGYMFPQYCIDNGIKKPLFVSEKKHELFLWEICVQFRYDKRMSAQFSIPSETEITLDKSSDYIVAPMKTKIFSQALIDDCDKIFVLSSEKNKIQSDKAIYLDSLEDDFIRKTYYEIPLLNFLKRYPKVKLIQTEFPVTVNQYGGGAEFEKTLVHSTALRNLLREDKSGKIKTLLDKFGYTNKEVLELVESPRLVRKFDGTTPFQDSTEKFLHPIKNGKMITAYQPQNYKNKIYFVGSCHFFGINAPFKKTIESYLQKMLNENNLPYCVENEGQHYWGRHQDLFYNLNALKPTDDDIIFVWQKNPSARNLPIFDISNVFDTPVDYKEIFCTKSHINELGYKLMAEKFFKYLTENNFFRDLCFNYPPPPPQYHRYGIPLQFEQGCVENSYGAEPETHKQMIQKEKLQIGAIVMNCTPFTLGHQFLVEYAAAKVSKLYIFVVEEDNRDFSFVDRMRLVRQGVKHIPNVEVLSSGKFVVSQQTFSGYFNEASLEIFGKEIAPTLGITIRFAGEEPTDNVTRQYNETMKKILPRYGVEFCEIPRKTFGDEVISASTVREALKIGNVDKVKSLVPATTFDYLRERHAEFRRYFTARIDVKLVTDKGDFQIVSVSDDKVMVLRPGWFQKGGIGYQIQSCGSKLTIIAKTTANGQILLTLRGLDIRTPKDKTKLIPYWIDYTKLTVNGKVIFDTLTPTWHNKPYRHTFDAKAGEEITFEVEWLPHKSEN